MVEEDRSFTSISRWCRRTWGRRQGQSSEGGHADHGEQPQQGGRTGAQRARAHPRTGATSTPPAQMTHAKPDEAHLKLLAGVLVHVGRAQHSVHLLAAAGARGGRGQLHMSAVAG